MDKSANNGSGGPTHYLVGGGIASLAAAVCLVRDAGVQGGDIRIFEQEDQPGGSLDGSGGSDQGYLVRGGRMFEENFVCTFDLLDSIPSTDAKGRSLKEDIELFNREVRGFSRCRLIRDGQRVDTSRLGLRFRDVVDLIRLTLRPEWSLADRTIESSFTPGFFKTNFWLMWSTMFAFQTWHSAMEMRRYLRRFIHLFPNLARLSGVLRTPYNQYDSVIAPISDWLVTQGVRIETGKRVVDIVITNEEGSRRVSELHLLHDDCEERLDIDDRDRVYLTLGSMTDCSTVGSNVTPPRSPEAKTSTWDFWCRLAERDRIFGRPKTFCADWSRTQWESFTVTLDNGAFFEFMEAFTGNVAGTGGLVTVADSGWLLSIVLFNQPHFRDQPEDVFVFWGYGLRGDRQGDFVKKPMAECSGNEILSELAGQLRLGDQAAEMFHSAKVVPCMMPYITSQFMPRRAGDRPGVIPEGAQNFAVTGQYCEMAFDTVFTVEYSVRSAMTAVRAMTGQGRPPPFPKRSYRNPFVLWRAVLTLLRG